MHISVHARTQKWPRHRPLISAVLEHDDLNDGGEHLLQDLRMHLENFEEGLGLVILVGAGGGRPGAFLTAFGELLKEEGDDVVECRATTRRHHSLDRA